MVIPVGVGPTEPAFADLGDFATPALEGVVVIEKAPLRFEIVCVGHVVQEFARSSWSQLLVRMVERLP
jgi:hypothetical protein